MSTHVHPLEGELSRASRFVPELLFSIIGLKITFTLSAILHHLTPLSKEKAPEKMVAGSLKESIQAKGRVKVRDAVRKRSGKEAPKVEVMPTGVQKTRPGRSAH